MSAVRPSGESPGGRVVAESEDFELLGVAQGRVLTFYLDRFTDNEPVIGATLDVDVNGETYSAEASEDGTYRITADWIAIAGRYDLIFTVVTADKSDLLTGALELTPPNMAEAGGVGTVFGFFNLSQGSVMSYALVFLLGLLTMVMARGAKGAESDPPAAAKGEAQRPVSVARRITEIFVSAHAKLAGQIGYLSGNLRIAGRPVVAYASTLAYAVIGALMVAIALIIVEQSVSANSGDDRGARGAGGAPTADMVATAGGAALSAPDSPYRRLDGTVYVPKRSQRLLEVTTAVTRVGEVGNTVRIAGQVIADPGTSGQIHSSIRGRLRPVADTWPRVGQKVTAGEVLAWVVPIVNPIDRNIIDQHLAQIDREMSKAQERIKHLTLQKSTPSARSLDEARYDLANLSRRRAAIATVLRDRDSLRAPLFAPADGVIAAAFAVAGQLVDEQQKLFEVVDPKRLWVEAYAYDITKLGDVRGANAVSSVGGQYDLEFVSRGPQLHQQTIPLYFKIDNPDSSLSVGSIVSVLANTSGQRGGVILPTAAVVKNTSGENIVWRHESPESFVPMAVRVEPIDGDRMLVLSGVKPNTRVVKTSAELLTQLR